MKCYMAIERSRATRLRVKERSDAAGLFKPMKRVGIFVCVFGAVLLAGCSGFRTAVRGRGPAGVRVSETLVHSFAGWPADGYVPDTTLVMDAAGNFYGTTANGCGNCEKLPHGGVYAGTRASRGANPPSLSIA